MDQTQTPNVVVVVVDALRPDVVTAETAPWMTNLAVSGVEFERAFSPINATEPLLASLYSGTYPATSGVYNHGTNLTERDIEVLDDLPFLQERFRAQGYETSAIDWLGNWHESGYDQYSGKLDESTDQRDRDRSGGRRRSVPSALLEWSLDRAPPSLVSVFRRAYFQVSEPSVQAGGWLPDSADDVVDAAIDAVETGTSPTYTFVHFWDTHAPYEVPDEYVQGDPDDPYDRYVGAVRFVDEQLRRLDERVDEATDRPTLYVVLGDHGESFGEHGIYFDHHGLYDATIHVPMILSHPDLPARTVDEFVQHVDIAPTLCDFLFDDPLPDVDGHSLLGTIRDGDPTRDAVIVEEAHTQRKAAIRTDRYKYIETVGDSAVCEGCHVVHGGERELYDLRSDPEERENMIERSPETAERLADRLDDWRSTHRTEHEASADDREIVDAELEQRLRDLGYR
ncbi:sulfatase family protein [Halococcoides cellulosivorans]|nr:sulfatase-like hydrolase/transferase [Halococcoides cellulosivorans]